MNDNVDRSFLRKRALLEQDKSHVPTGCPFEALNEQIAERARQVEERVAAAMAEPEVETDLARELTISDRESEFGRARRRKEKIKESTTITSGT